MPQGPSGAGFARTLGANHAEQHEQNDEEEQDLSLYDWQTQNDEHFAKLEEISPPKLNIANLITVTCTDKSIENVMFKELVF